MAVELSICIVAYNNYNEIKTAITSIDKYTSPELIKKIYIVDNGVSISNLHEIAEFKSFIEKNVNVEYIDTGKNLGFGKGHNQILGIINSKYHAIVNPDIVFCEDAFSKIIEWMNNNKEIGMTIPLITDEYGNRLDVYRNELTYKDILKRVFIKGKFKYTTKQNVDFTKPFQVPFGQGSFLVIRTELFKSLNGFDDNFFMYVEDADLCKRVNMISKLMYFPDAKVIHKWKKESHMNKTLLKYHIKSIRYYFQKWG